MPPTLRHPVTTRRVVPVLGLMSLAVPAGVAAHCAGYELAARGQSVLGPIGGGDGAHDSHSVGAHGPLVADAHASHLPLVPLTTGALLVGALVLLAALLGGRRMAGIGAPRLGTLLAAQFAVLVAVEVAGLAAGMSPPAASVLLAVALQLPVAVALVLLARGTRRLLGRLLRATPGPARRRPLALRPSAVVSVTGTVLWSSRPPGRGPPLLGGVPTSAAMSAAA